NDYMFGSGGTDVLIDARGSNKFYDNYATATIYGLESRPPTASMLGMTGQLRASLDAYDSVQKVLTINGPTGLGFQLSGPWVSDEAGAETFTAKGTVYLKTPAGDLPLPASSAMPIKVTTAADTLAEAGAVTNVELGAPMNLATGAAGPVFSQFQSKLGMD